MTIGSRAFTSSAGPSALRRATSPTDSVGPAWAAIFQSPVNLPVIAGVQNRRQKSAAAGHQSRPLIRLEGMQSENTLVRSDDAVS